MCVFVYVHLCIQVYKLVTWGQFHTYREPLCCRLWGLHFTKQMERSNLTRLLRMTSWSQLICHINNVCKNYKIYLIILSTYNIIKLNVSLPWNSETSKSMQNLCWITFYIMYYHVLILCLWVTFTSKICVYVWLWHNTVEIMII